MPQVELTGEEVLALTWALEHWALGGNTRSNCPFVYRFGTSALAKLQEAKTELPSVPKDRLDEDGDYNLWDHPLAEAFYNSHFPCEECGYYNKEGTVVCEECGSDGSYDLEG